MRISTKGRYALRMMIDIAQHGADNPVHLKDIADRQQVSKKYLEQIAAQLALSGLLIAVRGQAGGYRLAGRPSAHTLYEILSATEGPIHSVSCLDSASNDCPRHDTCLTLPIWEGLDHVVRDYLSGITLQDLLDQSDSKQDN